LQNTLSKKHIGWPRKGLADVSFCGKIELMRNNLNTQDQYKVSVENNQLVLVLNSEILLPEDAPVRVTSAQLEELDYRKLYEAYSSKGRKSVADPRVLFKVMAYGYQCGIYSSRKLEEACKYRVDFMWLLENGKAPDHSTLSRFRTGRCAEAVEDLFYQYIQLLEKQNEVDHKSVFIDGTKIESRAGRYTFNWRGTAEKNLAKAKQKALELTGCKTLSELEILLSNKAEDIPFVGGKGKHKTEEQREWEEIDHLCQQWRKYEEQLAIMGEDRNSYSKTDPDATFMRMKEDHMRNGQLKPAYNVQIAVNSEYITGIDVFSNRTDVGTLIPFLHKLEMAQQKRYEEVVADAGYESEDNYLYLEANGQMSFIKPSNYEAQKTKKYRSQIGRIENMKYDKDEDCFICAEGRNLYCRKVSTEVKNGTLVTRAWYRCESCSNCPQREKCCRKQDLNAPKEVIMKETFWAKRQQSLENITSERGIHLRMNRSIQVEGAFGLIKNDFGFRRFLTTGKKNVQIELLFLALGFNLKKRWMKQQKRRLETHYSEKKVA
jgi:transposase